MFHKLRATHRWIGVILGVVLLLIAITGFLLATKGTFGWVRPPTQDGTPIKSFAEVRSLDEITREVFALGNKNLDEAGDIDRIDYRPKQNIFKVLSKEGYLEVQVDGATARVLSQETRVDQIAEDVHDLSFFSNLAKDYFLPLVAIGLAVLSVTGTWMYLVPVLRRRQHRLSAAAKKSEGAKAQGKE